MATTWLKALHSGGNPIEYVLNTKKTRGSELIDSYECDSFTAQSEFLLSKELYAKITGRDQGKHAVMAYHMRMSFKPDEVSAEQALELGKELALRWTKGKHQYVVASHTNTKNPHAHIIFNSVNLSCERKFNDFKRSAIALRRVSDQLCLERGLSIIENPALSKGYNRDEYLGQRKPPTAREKLKGLIDKAITESHDFNAFIAALEAAGVDVKRGKQLAFKLPDSRKFCRLDTLGNDYSMDAINERLAGKQNLLFEIQDKIQQCYRETPSSDLKEISKTLLFLKEHSITKRELLAHKAKAATTLFHEHNVRRKTIETRLGEIEFLQKQNAVYTKTKEVFKQYRDGGFNKKFYSVHQLEIEAHRDAKRAFLSLGFKRLPSVDSLRNEHHLLDAEMKVLSRGFRSERDEMIALLRAKDTTDRFLSDPVQRHSKTHELEAR